MLTNLLKEIKSAEKWTLFINATSSVYLLIKMLWIVKYLTTLSWVDINLILLYVPLYRPQIRPGNNLMSQRNTESSNDFTFKFILIGIWRCAAWKVSHWTEARTAGEIQINLMISRLFLLSRSFCQRIECVIKISFAKFIHAGLFEPSIEIVYDLLRLNEMTFFYGTGSRYK